MAKKSQQFWVTRENFLNVDFAWLYYLNKMNLLIISTDWRKRMFSLSSWKFHYPTIIGRWENGEKNRNIFEFLEKIF